jgi:hypothetical protein
MAVITAKPPVITGNIYSIPPNVDVILSMIGVILSMIKLTG